MQDGIPTPGWQSYELHTPDEMHRFLARVMDGMRRLWYSDKEQFGVRLALEEAIVNAIKHGHRGDLSKTVRVCYHVTPAEVRADVEDEGPGFDPFAVPDPLAPENLEQPGGRGVFLMRHYMTAVEFNAAGNRVTLCKVRNGPFPQAPG